MIPEVLNEDPDILGVSINGKRPHMLDNDALAFAMKKGKVYLGKGLHPGLISSNKDLYDQALKDPKLKKFLTHSAENKPISQARASKFLSNNWDAVETIRKFFDFAGRLWFKSKVISFWEFPDREELYDIISKINKESKGFKIDKTWKIEVINDKNKEVLVPIDQYNGEKFSKKKFDLSKLHTMEPKEKKKALHDIGADKAADKLKVPKGMTVAQYRSLTRQEGFTFKEYYELFEEANA